MTEEELINIVELCKMIVCTDEEQGILMLVASRSCGSCDRSRVIRTTKCLSVIHKTETKTTVSDDGRVVIQRLCVPCTSWNVCEVSNSNIRT